MNGNNIPWMRLFCTMLAFVACSVYVRPFFKSFRPPDGVAPDFYQEWASARNYLEGLPIYAHQSLSSKRYLEALHFKVGASPQVAIEYNAHPPTSVLLALPLARLDFPNAFLAWSVASFTALCVSITIVVRQCPGALTAWSILPLAALLLWCNPLWQQVLQGQINLVLLLLFTAAWAADRSERPWLAGALVGAATALKLFPGYLFLYFAARRPPFSPPHGGRRGEALAAGACCFLALTALTVLILGPACYGDYTTVVVPSLEKWRVFWPNLSLAGFWHKLFNSQGSHVIPLWQNPALAWTATLLSDAVVTVLTACCIWRSHTLRERDLAFALTIVAMLLVSPITWDHYFTLVFLPLFLLWFWAPSGWRTRMAFWIILIGIWLAPLFYWRFAFPRVMFSNWMQLTATPRHAVTVLAMHTYVLLGLFVFTMLVLARGSANQTPAPATCKRAVHE